MSKNCPIFAPLITRTKQMDDHSYSSLHPKGLKPESGVKENTRPRLTNVNTGGGYLTLLYSSKFTQRKRRFFLYDLFTIFLSGMPTGMRTLFFNRIKSPGRFAGMRGTIRSAGRFPYHLLSFPVVPDDSRTTYDLFSSLRNIAVHLMTTSRSAGKFPYHLLSFPVVPDDSRTTYDPFPSHMESVCGSITIIPLFHI